MKSLTLNEKFSEKLYAAISRGAVRIDYTEKKALIAAPKNSELLSDDEWLTLLREAGEYIKELESLGYEVTA
jgi:hypothetical protein